ncbi:casp-like protein 4a3 [Quercus suber]|uniref:CASP-like protein n=1 Tax=Quercus suber TaxID=58331 RepID=A0AAW0IRM2_QUESU
METQTQTQNQKQSQEAAPQQQQQQNQKNKANMKKSTSKNSDSSAHYNDSPHSPLRFHSPLRSELGDPPETPPYHSPEASPEKPPPDYSKAVVAVDKYTQFSPQQSTPEKPNLTNSNNNNNNSNAATQTEKSPSPLVVVNRAMREEPPMSVAKVGPSGGGVGRGVEDGRRSAHISMVRRTKRDIMVGKAALAFRFSEIVLCLISFSVMAADKTQGWSGDSFDRYTEYRYCLSVNVIAFVYSGFQAFDLASNMISGKHVIRHHLRRHFTFFMDQASSVLAYLLISASSSAASRVDDWQSNWGKDEFTIMASASVGMAFLAFVAFAFSSLISGYYLFAHDST